MRKGKRTISKAKMYGFHPWVDQVDAIDQLVGQTGEKESTILRKLVDEALIARRRTIADTQLNEPVSDKASPDTLETIQALLLKLIRKTETSLKIEDIILALAQEILAEARACRTVTWDQTLPSLKEQGLNSLEVAKRFDAQTAKAKDFAYETAQNMKRQQK